MSEISKPKVDPDCPYRTVACVVWKCCKKIRFNLIENHMAEKHSKMSNGQWEIYPQDGEETEMQTLEGKARAILNKLTPQKFDTLVRKFQELGINTEDKLQRCVACLIGIDLIS